MADETNTENNGEAQGQVETNAGETQAKAPEAAGDQGSAVASASGGEGGATGREAGAASSSQAEGGGEAKPTAKPHWAEGRLAKKTAELAEARKQLEDLTRENATRGTGETPAQFEARVQAETSRRLAEAQAQGRDAEFNSALEREVALGKKSFGDEEFTKATNSLGRLCDNSSPAERQRYVSFLQTMLDTGEMPKLVLALGQDLEEAERIMGLSPGKQGVALAKLAAKEAAEPSRTPRPPKTTVGARGAAMGEIKASDPDRSGELSTAEWMKRREAEVKAQREQRA